MSTVSIKIEIKAPLEHVWETIMDPGRLAEWVTIHRSVSNVSANPMRKGATMDQAMHIRGVTFKVRWRLDEVNPPNVAVWEGRGPAHSSARIRYALSDRGDGVTVFDYFNEFKPPGGRLGSVASRLVVGGVSEREARRTLKRLKALLERDSS
jgi:carbon monoxide dehydrogenase subunit G